MFVYRKQPPSQKTGNEANFAAGNLAVGYSTLISNTFQLCADYLLCHALLFNDELQATRISTVVFDSEEGLHTQYVFFIR